METYRCNDYQLCELVTLYIDGVFFDSAQLSADGLSATTIGTIGDTMSMEIHWRGDIAEVLPSHAIEYTSGFTPQYPLPVTNNTEVLYTFKMTTDSMS